MRTQCHFWSPVASITLRSILLAAIRITSRKAGSNIPLVAIVPSKPLRLPFSLYAIRWSPTCVAIFLAVKATLIASTISAVSLRFHASAPAFQERRICLSASVGALTGPGNSATAVLSWALPHSTVVVCLFWLTVCLCCTGVVRAPDAATLAMLGCAGRFWCVRVSGGVGAGRCALGARRGCGTCHPAPCCLGVCLFATAAATSRSEINERRVALAGGVYVGVTLAATVLHTFLVRSAT